jgi:hypothetical protein
MRGATGALFLIGALAFATAATYLSATFDWPEILREPANVVLTRFAAGGPSLVWTWFASRGMRQTALRWRLPGSPSTSSAAPSSANTLGSCSGSAGPSPLSIVILRTRVLPRWLGVLGLLVSLLYLLNQGDILATALPGFSFLTSQASLEAAAGDFGWQP